MLDIKYDINDDIVIELEIKVNSQVCVELNVELPVIVIYA